MSVAALFYPQPDVLFSVVAVVCAWCKRVMEPGSDLDVPISHGVCSGCAAKMRAEMKAARS